MTEVLYTPLKTAQRLNESGGIKIALNFCFILLDIICQSQTKVLSILSKTYLL